MNLKVAGIYLITNRLNAKVYVGSAMNIAGRFRAHKNTLARNVHANGKLQNAWNKYGPDAFVFSVLERVDDCALLTAREQVWIDAYVARGDVYNIALIAYSSFGVKCSDETRKKISLAKTGIKMSPESRAKKSAAMKGRVVSEETKRKLSIARTGRRHTPEVRAKMSVAQLGNTNNLGKKASAETRKKISDALTGNAINLGRVHSEQSRKRMAAARTGLKHSEEAKRRMSIAQQARYAGGA